MTFFQVIHRTSTELYLYQMVHFSKIEKPHVYLYILENVRNTVGFKRMGKDHTKNYII